MDSEKKQLELLKDRISYKENIFGDNRTYEKALTKLLEDAKYIALSLRYPYEDFSAYELPKKYFLYNTSSFGVIIIFIKYIYIKSLKY